MFVSKLIKCIEDIELGSSLLQTEETTRDDQRRPEPTNNKLMYFVRGKRNEKGSEKGR